MINHYTYDMSVVDINGYTVNDAQVEFDIIDESDPIIKSVVDDDGNDIDCDFSIIVDLVNKEIYEKLFWGDL